MLILSRRKNESIVVNNDITITVVEIRGDKVRLGIVCPKDVPVHRQEVFEAIHGWSRPAPPAPPPEYTAFLRAIEADPGNEATRLVFADWLEERGDPLGEFVRLSCQLRAATAARLELQRRYLALWQQHSREWAALLPAVLWPR